MFHKAGQVLTLSVLVLAASNTRLFGEQNQTQVLVARARVLDAQGRHDLAAEDWRQVLLMDPQQPEGLEALVRYYRSTGDTTRAQKYESVLSRVRPGGTVTPGNGATPREDVNSMLRQAAQLASRHEYAESIRLYQQAFGSAQPPDDWAVAYYETEAAMPSTQQHGVAGLRALAQKYPMNPSYRLALAKVLTYRAATRHEGIQMLSAFQGAAEQNEQARAAWRQAIVWDISTAAASESGKAYLERYPDQDLSTRLAAAAQRTATNKQTSPLEGEGYKALADGDLTAATERFTTLSEEPGHGAQGKAGLGYVDMKRKDFSGAIAHFEEARAAGVHSPALEKALKEARYWDAMTNGNNALAAQDSGKAAAEFARARAVNTARPEATEALGGSLLAGKDPVTAESVFAEELKNNPHRPDAWTGWMNAALENGHASEILARQSRIPSDAKTVLAKRPDYLALLACAELATGDSEEAARLLERIGQVAHAGAGQGSAAQVRAAGLLLQRGYFEQATQLCVAAIKEDRENADAWQTLVQAEHVAGRDDIALKVAGEMPQTVGVAAMRNPDFLLALAAVHQKQQRFDTAATLLDRAEKLSSVSGANSSGLKMQRASLALARGDAHSAYTLYRSVAEQYSDNAEAWSGMVNALHTGKHDPEALATIEGLSASMTARLRHDDSFLQVAAFVYSQNGRTREAMLCLRAVSNRYRQQHQAVPFSVNAEYAWLLLNAGNDAELGAILDQIALQPHLTNEQRQTIHQIWSAWSMRRAEVDYKNGDAKKAIAILQTGVRAYPDRPELVNALANMYVRSGSPNLALKIYVQMNWERADVEQFRAAIEAALAAHNKSYADSWLKMGLEQHSLDSTLLRLAARMEEERGHRKKAETYLQAASGPVVDSGSLRADAFPVQAFNFKPEVDSNPIPAEAETTPEVQLARMLGAGSNAAAVSQESSEAPPSPAANQPIAVPVEATAMLKHLSYEQPGSQPAAAGSSDSWDGGVAPTPKRTQEVARPEWPGEVAPSSAGPAKSSAEDLVNGLDEVPASTPAHSSGQSDILSELDNSSKGKTKAHAPARPVTDSGSEESGKRILKGIKEPTRESGLTDGLEAELQPRVSSGMFPAASGIVSIAPVVSPAQQRAADDLTALESRYSPWLATGGMFRSHSGTKGFDQLQESEFELESSAVIGEGARITAVGRPVLLQSGIPDSTSNYRFGTGSSLPQTAQFASGFGVEVQLATRSLQASVGLSPTNFLVSNGIGSLALRPGQGPFTLRVYRSPVKDSLLSYAGMKDPDSGQIWGGVVATGGAVEFSHGSAESGFYASADGQKVTGRNVADNTRIMGNAGAYWLAYSNPYGQLKVGANLTAMHYALNERYFSFGQGGYFSPNAFLMANAPITWESRPMYQTFYQVSGSLGAQNIQQGEAISGSLIAGNGIETITSASYDLHARVVYRATEHWNLEGFFDTNNARQYAERSAGFTLRFMRSPQPAEYVPNGFLNQTDIRPLVRP